VKTPESYSIEGSSIAIAFLQARGEASATMIERMLVEDDDPQKE